MGPEGDRADLPEVGGASLGFVPGRHPAGAAKRRAPGVHNADSWLWIPGLAHFNSAAAELSS
jgi:hypothetical protein